MTLAEGAAMESGPTISVRTADLDEAREVCGLLLYPRAMRLLEPGAVIDGRFSFLRLDGMTLADVRYGAAVAGATSELGSYHVNVPRAGRFYASQHHRPISGDPQRAAVYRPVGDTTLHYSSADCHLHALKIETSALERHLRVVLGVPSRGIIRLSGHLDTERGPGRSFTGLVRLLAQEIGNPDSLYAEPVVAEPVKEALMTSLLLAADHQYRDRLSDGAYAGYAHRSIAAVVDAIHAEPLRAHTLASLAEIGGLPGARLRTEFRRQHGTTPMVYLREVRLLAAHADLAASEPGETSVAAVARRWGFVRLDRFVARYRSRFQVSPDATLGRGILR